MFRQVNKAALCIVAALLPAAAQTIVDFNSSDVNARMTAFYAVTKTTSLTDAQKTALFSLLQKENDYSKQLAAQDSDVSERYGGYYSDVVTTVAGLKDARSVSALAGAMRTGHLVADALASFGPATIPSLSTAVNSSDVITRFAAVMTVKKMLAPGNAASVGDANSKTQISAILAKAAVDSDADIRQLAKDAQLQLANPGKLAFYPIAPCRVIDTRAGQGTTGQFGPPALAAGSTRSFVLPGRCGLPADAKAYSLNVTVVPKGPLGYVTLWPTGQLIPFVSTLNSLNGQILANAAVVPAGEGGAVSVYSSDATDVVIDVNGYFASPQASSGLLFHSIQPCRAVDTRAGQGTTGDFGPPSLAGGTRRSFALPFSRCGGLTNPLSQALAYSVNITVVPKGPLGYITAWPTARPQPVVSTLNALTGAITANAAIVPTDASGSIDVYASNATDIIIDINGYFAPASAGSGLSFVPVQPCRATDTRSGQGTSGSFGPPSINAATTRSMPLALSRCAPPANVQAFSLNFTVVPKGPLGYLSTWPSGQPQPVVSTLNALNGQIVANAAIVPAGTNGSIDVYASNSTDVVVDVNGYFVP